jgi:hypothetical protein
MVMMEKRKRNKKTWKIMQNDHSSAGKQTEFKIQNVLPEFNFEISRKKNERSGQTCNRGFMQSDFAVSYIKLAKD